MTGTIDTEARKVLEVMVAIMYRDGKINKEMMENMVRLLQG